jgi:DNA polymerase phi
LDVDSLQDERDHYFGRVFGAEAIVKSCILFSPQPFLHLWRDLLQRTCQLALKKQWLRQECGWLFFTSISFVRSSNLEPEFALAVVESLKANNLVRTPEGVAVWLEVRTSYPEATLPKHIWKHRNPLCKAEVTSLSEVMKDAKAKQQQSESGESNASQGAGTWSQQLHFSWEVILRELFLPASHDQKASSERISFVKFWADVVDGE